MANILFFSDNEVFKADMREQISCYAPEFVFNETAPDLLIVDGSAEKALRLRAGYPEVPLLFLGESCEFAEDSLNVFVKKPFVLSAFLDTLRAANNRLDNSAEGYLRFNGYELRPSRREIEDTFSGTVSRLTEKEVSILKYLYKMSGSYVSKSDLQKNVWGYSGDVATHTIETHIYRLRQKVEKDESRRLIATDNGGYKLQAEEPCRN